MFFAVFEASVELQEHANHLRKTKPMKRDLVTLQASCQCAPLMRLAFSAPSPHQNRPRRAREEKVGLSLIGADRSGPVGLDIIFALGSITYGRR